MTPLLMSMWKRSCDAATFATKHTTDSMFDPVHYVIGMLKLCVRLFVRLLFAISTNKRRYGLQFGTAKKS